MALVYSCSRPFCIEEEVMTGLFSKLFGRKNRIDVGRITENETEESNSTFRAERSNSFVEITVVTDQAVSYTHLTLPTKA